MSLKERVRELNGRPFRKDGRYVLYWIQANRRVEANHALLWAAELANQLDLPLLCLEQLCAPNAEAGDRQYTFVLEGVPEREKSFRRLGAGYVFHLGEGKPQSPDVLKLLAGEAAAVVTDDHPTLARFPDVAVACFAVDSSCIVPMALIGKLEYAAYTIRSKIHRQLDRCLQMPLLPRLRRRWQEPPPPFHFPVREASISKIVAACPINHRVAPSLTFSGRRSDALKHLERFLQQRLHRYARLRNEPPAHATSDLSPSCTTA